MNLDALVPGTAIAGLWTLKKLSHRIRSTLLIEQTPLGHGQTIASPGQLRSITLHHLTSGEAIALHPH